MIMLNICKKCPRLRVRGKYKRTRYKCMGALERRTQRQKTTVNAWLSKLIATPDGRRKVAESMAEGIRTYTESEYVNSDLPQNCMMLVEQIVMMQGGDCA